MVSGSLGTTQSVSNHAMIALGFHLVLLLLSLPHAQYLKHALFFK